MTDPSQERTSDGSQDQLFHRTSRAIFWNSIFSPLVFVLNLATSIVIRRWFGLQSGVYDILIGVCNTVLAYSQLGIPASIVQFLPQLERSADRRQAIAFLRWTVLTRLFLLSIVLIPMNLYAAPLADWMGLPESGTHLIYVLSALVVARGVLELGLRALQALLAHFSANAVIVSQAALDLGFIAASLAAGYGIAGLLGSLASVAGSLFVVTTVLLWRFLANRTRSPSSNDTSSAPRLPAMRVARFAGFIYVFDLSLYFAGPNFAKAGLAPLFQAPEPIALFSAGYGLAFMAVTVAVSVFRGTYRPLFAHIRAEQDPERLRRAFQAVNKLQILLLLPAATGLALLADDLLVFLYGPSFEPAAGLLRIIVPFLVAEAVFNVSIVVVTVFERYRDLALPQALRILSAPLLLAAAHYGGIVAATATLGIMRGAAAFAAYRYCRRAFGVSVPWPFAARCGAATGFMALIVLAVRFGGMHGPSWILPVTLAGIGGYLVALRAFAVLRTEEIRLLERSHLPGAAVLLRWLTTRR